MTDLQFSIELLKQAAATLTVAIQKQPRDEFVSDSIIQRFECTYELSWKTLKRYFLQNTGSDEYNVMNIWRDAAKHKLIADPKIWFTFHKARNATSHTYNQKVATFVLAQAIEFHTEIGKLIERLEVLNEGG